MDFPNMYELCLMHARADRAMRSVVFRQLEPHGLTMMEWLALGVISTAPKNGLSMSEVATALDVTLPQVTALVNGLINSNFARQKVLSSDHRGRQVLATIKGRRTLGKLESVIAVTMGGWSKDIPPDELQVYVKTVSKLAQTRTTV